MDRLTPSWSAIAGLVLLFPHYLLVTSVNNTTKSTLGNALGFVALFGLLFLVLWAIVPRLPVVGRHIRTNYQEQLHPFIRHLWQYNYTVEAVNQLNQQTVEVILTPVAQPVSFVAGQFLFVRFGGGLGWERHPFTVSSAPQEASLRLSIKALGDETQRLFETLQPGIPARVGIAFGMFDYRRGSSRQVWIAGGIGITPFRRWIHAFPPERERSLPVRSS